MRPTWDEYFIGICKAVAKRSHDEDTQVGCVIVDNHNRVVSTGYNGLPPGVVDKSFWPCNRKDKIGKIVWHTEKDITKYDVMTHAEINAIANSKESLQGYTMYCEYMPCHPCALAIIASGIKRIVYVLRNPRTDEKGSYRITEELCAQAKVQLDHIKPEKLNA